MSPRAPVDALNKTRLVRQNEFSCITAGNDSDKLFLSDATDQYLPHPPPTHPNKPFIWGKNNLVSENNSSFWNTIRQANTKISLPKM
jgi:hypothetical protein